MAGCAAAAVEQRPQLRQGVDQGEDLLPIGKDLEVLGISACRCAENSGQWVPKTVERNHCGNCRGAALDELSQAASAVAAINPHNRQIVRAATSIPPSAIPRSVRWMATQRCVDAKLTISGRAEFSMRVIGTDATRRLTLVSQKCWREPDLSPGMCRLGMACFAFRRQATKRFVIRTTLQHRAPTLAYFFLVTSSKIRIASIDVGIPPYCDMWMMTSFNSSGVHPTLSAT